VRLVIDAVKVPVVPPEVAHVPPVVGLLVVAQHTPRTVIVSPPSLVTLPLPVAVVAVIEEAAEVATAGAVLPPALYSSAPASFAVEEGLVSPSPSVDG
jgi:hypothetical protein